MKIAEILAMLKDDGWYLVATKAGKPSDDVAHGTRNSIFKQTFWK